MEVGMDMPEYESLEKIDVWGGESKRDLQCYVGELIVIPLRRGLSVLLSTVIPNGNPSLRPVMQLAFFLFPTVGNF